MVPLLFCKTKASEPPGCYSEEAGSCSRMRLNNSFNMNLLRLLCAAVLCTTLTLGLWPFHSPGNGVGWLPNQNGLRFGGYATVFSSRPLPDNSPNESGATVEIWLKPRCIWDSGTFLAFYRREDRFQFSLHQSETDLLLIIGDRPSAPAVLHVDDFFHRDQTPFLTITSGAQGTCIYSNGVLLHDAPHFQLSPRDLSGLIILGDSARQPNSWQGRLLGLAFYHSRLTAEQVLRNYRSWTQQGRPAAVEREYNFALYTFDEHAGRVIRDRAKSGVDLYIPEKYHVVDKIALEPVWSEFELSRSYGSAAVKNIVGFIPLGFCFYVYLAALLPARRATLITIGLGAAVSIMIEILQAFLPTRDSGTTDIITNTFGTWLGIESFRLAARLLPRFFLRLGLSVPG